MSGEVLLQKLERPRKPSDPTEGAAYMMGIEDATADREWCYSKTKPGTTQLQPALLDLIRSLPPAEAGRNAALVAAYPKRPGEGIPHSGIDQAALYESIGYKEFASDPRMQNTCATRVSLALLAAGIHPAPGNLTVQAGRFAGLRIETNQQALSKFLRKRLGSPEVYKSGYEAWGNVKPRHGIVSFFHLTWATCNAWARAIGRPRRCGSGPGSRPLKPRIDLITASRVALVLILPPTRSRSMSRRAH